MIIIHHHDRLPEPRENSVLVDTDLLKTLFYDVPLPLTTGADLPQT